MNRYYSGQSPINAIIKSHPAARRPEPVAEVAEVKEAEPVIAAPAPVSEPITPPVDPVLTEDQKPEVTENGATPNVEPPAEPVTDSVVTEPPAEPVVETPAKAEKKTTKKTTAKKTTTTKKKSSTQAD